LIIRPSCILFRRTLLALAIVATAFFAFGTAGARAETRTLKIYYIHTGEKAEITFKRNGRYDQKGLDKLNWFLRDWRRNEPTKMDPRLFDLVWEVYQRVGASDYINVVSAYRAPETNAMLRKNTSGVAKKSQHIQGRAMDFFIPGVPLAKLRATAMKLQRGGVGYYPRSGSPFVHLDVASVRAWPRMSRSQLSSLFPEGHTLHLPADGKPLPGYAEALAEYKAKGSVSGSEPVRVARASTNDDSDEDEGRTLLGMLFKRGGDGNQSSGASGSQSPSQNSAPAQRPVDILTAAVSFDNLDIPVPLSRPGGSEEGPGTALATALVDPNPIEDEAETDLALAANIPLPQERPATIASSSDLSVSDVLVDEQLSGGSAERVEVASLEPGRDPESVALALSSASVPVPSPRLAYAETGSSEGLSFDPSKGDAPSPVRDPRRKAHSVLAGKLEEMGDTTVVAVNEQDDFRAVFQPTVARLRAAVPEAPVKGERPVLPVEVALGTASAGYTGSISAVSGSSGSLSGQTNTVKSNKKTISEYFDAERF